MACCALLKARKAWLWMEACWLICGVLVAWRMMTGGSPQMLCWRVPANLRIWFYWASLSKWRIFYAEGHLLIFENWLTSWKPKLLPRWSACRIGLCMNHCKLPDFLLCIWIQQLVGRAVWWNKRWLELSGGLLTCLMPVFHVCLTGGILTWFGMFGVRGCF